MATTWNLKGRSLKANFIFSTFLTLTMQLKCKEIQMQRIYQDGKRNMDASRLNEVGSISKDHGMMLDNWNHQRSNRSCVFDVMEEKGRMSWDIFDIRNAVTLRKKKHQRIQDQNHCRKV